VVDAGVEVEAVTDVDVLAIPAPVSPVLFL